MIGDSVSSAARLCDLAKAPPADAVVAVGGSLLQTALAALTSPVSAAP